MSTQMTVNRFRLLMLLSVGLLIWASVATMIAQFQAVLVLPASDHPQWSGAATFGAVFSFAYLILGGAGFVGMYLLRPWGRSLSLIVTVLMSVIGVGFAIATDPAPPPPVPITAAISVPLGQLSTLTWGAVLALAYHSPVGMKFIARSSSEPEALGTA